MKKEDLLREIANQGYNAGFGAKVSFASFDMLRFLPGFISFSSTALGVLGLVFDTLSTKAVSAGVLVIGLISYYITVKDSHLRDLEDSGKKLTDIRNQLGILYGKVKAYQQADFAQFTTELSSLQQAVISSSTSKQLIFSGWLAHMKFFGESQIAWIDEELKFGFWRDKVPTSLKVSLFAILLLTVLGAVLSCCCSG
jgi:hypothetical protein